MVDKFTPFAFTEDDTKPVRVKTAYQGYAQVKAHTVRHKRFDGTWTSELTRELFVSGDAVAVLPFDPASNKVVLVEQWRVSAHDRGDHPWLVECIAGRVEPGESPEEVARREALEEANCPLGHLVKIGSYYPSPGIFAEFVTYFCAKADLSGVGGIYGLADEEEDVRAFVTDLDDALAALNDGRILAATSFMCLTWLQQNKDRLVKEWARS